MLSTIAFAVFAADPLVLTSQNFDDVIKGSKPAFVKFFAPWCGHCKKLKPDWDKLANEVDSDKIVIADVDCTDGGKAICEKEGIKGYPTLKYYEDGESEDYDGERSLTDLKTFAEGNANGNKCSLQTKKECEPADLELLEKFEKESAADIKSEIATIATQLFSADEYLNELLKKLQTEYKEAAEARDSKKTALKKKTRVLKSLLKAKSAADEKEEL